jgi:long-subunit fatty acid transport protein
MKKSTFKVVTKSILGVITLLFSFGLFAQGPTNMPKSPNDFWRNVQFGGGIGLSIGSGYTDITIAPSAIYNINQIVSVGTALQFGYISAKNDYSSTLYGASLIGLVNPIPEVQLSVELEEINVNTDYQYLGGNNTDTIWNTALYLGAGYRTGNVTIGVRYDVLFDNNNGYYSDPFMPFMRVYF